MRTLSTFRILSFLIFSSILSVQVFSQISENISLVSYYGNGPSDALALKGDTLFYHNGGYLEAVDVSDRENPVFLGKMATPALITEIYIHKNYAYLSLQYTGLFVVDISDPSAMTIEKMTIFSNYVYGTAFKNNYLYAFDNIHSFLTIDISNPLMPVPVDTLLLENDVKKIIVKGDSAYAV